MEECSICLLNGSATGTETLKNLVLPGIGSFTVVDGAQVTEADLGNNFFLDSTCLGKPRAQCVTELLKELNEHVSGSYVCEDVSEVLAARPDFLHAFTMVIATQMPQTELRHVASICHARKIPLLLMHTYGFLGYLRLDLGEHSVVEAHPDHPMPDVRILHPPAAMRAYVDAHYADLGALSSSAFAHTPWAVLLVKAVDEWKQANGGALPTAYKQKKEVKTIVEGYRRPGMQADQNIDEALAAVNTALNTPSPSGSVAAVFSAARSRLSSIVAEQRQSAYHQSESDVSPGSALSKKKQLSFWLMAAATQQFVDNEGGGLLPLIGTIPDMTADTSTYMLLCCWTMISRSYVALQQLYAQQAASDLAAVQAHAREIAAVEGLAADHVEADELKRFCKNANAIQLLSYHSVAGEYGISEDDKEGKLGGPTQTANALASSLGDTSSAASLYLLLRAAQAFRAERTRWPGHEDDFAQDVPQLKQCVADLVKDLGLTASSPVSDELTAEFCRWGGAEMHAIASVMGGIAAQEAIKAATNQYIPLNNTFIFNGANGTTATLEL